MQLSPGNGIDVSKTIVKTEKQDCNTTQEDLEITAIIPVSDLSERKAEFEKPDPSTGRNSTAGRELSSDARKFWESGEKEIVMKHYGTTHAYQSNLRKRAK